MPRLILNRKRVRRGEVLLSAAQVDALASLRAVGWAKFPDWTPGVTIGALLRKSVIEREVVQASDYFMPFCLSRYRVTEKSPLT